MPIQHTIEEREFKNDAQALLIDVPGAPVANYGIHFEASPNMFTIPDQSRHVLEHVATEYTTDAHYSDPKKLRQSMEQNGAYSNASTDTLGTTYYGDCISGEIGRIINLRRMTVERPNINDDSVGVEKGNVLQELRRNIGNQQRLAYALAQQAIGSSVLTDTQKIESAGKVTTANVRDVYERTHLANNLKVIIAGDFKNFDSSADDMIESWNLKKGEPISNMHDANTVVKRRFETFTHSKSVFANIVFSADRDLSLIEQNDLQVINYILFNSHASKAFGELRLNGISYQMHGSRNDSMLGQTLWNVEFPVTPDNLNRVIEVIVKYLMELSQTGVTKEEVHSAVNFLRGRFMKYGLTAGQLMDEYGDKFFHKGYVRHMDEQLEAYDEITPDTVISTLRTFLDSGKWAYGGAGNMDKKHFVQSFDRFEEYMEGRSK